jgi:hypothetical protein
MFRPCGQERSLKGGCVRTTAPRKPRRLSLTKGLDAALPN